ncbi:hypothetical protein FXO38_13450 [Capsicum annuum]|uniref:Receptor-like serine/threonine-protein kinase n=1 Tax=Capsicum annuum TaxID=4072 RepID=A0A2G2XZG6_CAPAN|nr:hypothetical protein FXO38_13450 [Capsicum annuum]PHT62883.1 hypothetical protein T459_33264 [Capsicum annuum]
MAEKLGGVGLIDELCKGFELLMDRNKGVITFESLPKNSALLGLQDLSDDDLRYMVKEADFDGRTCAGSVSLRQSQSLNDGESLSSEVGTFELGFISPGSSKDRFLGIWYKNIPVRTVVWVANRNTPIRDRTGELTINSTGSVVVTSRISGDIWSTSSFTNAKAPVLQLLDSGNLILRDEKGSNSDLSSWRNSDDPSPGELSNGIELHEYPQAVIWKGSRKYFRGGPWTGDKSSGAPELRVNPVFDYSFISNKNEVYYIYQLKNKSVISRLFLNDTSSSRQRYVWVEADQAWRLYASVPRDYCDTYSLCGANGVCVMSDSPVCQCLEGFKPKSSERWKLKDWSQGCMLSKPLNCQNKDVFIKFSHLKLPDTVNSGVDGTMSIKDCREACLKNCSCMAYSNSNIRGQEIGCVLWFGDLIDIRQIPNGGQDLYIRIEASGQGASLKGLWLKHWLVVKAFSVSLITVAVLSVLVFLCYYLSRRKKKDKGIGGQDCTSTEGPKGDLELPFFDLATVAHATDNFSVNKQLGEGGFGPVYKIICGEKHWFEKSGTPEDGQQIAVKRLSKSSGQGLNELKNEVKLIAKLQHRNLVKLIGSCIDDEEKMLIYKYMANGSLDSLVFDQTRRKQLGWSKFFQIIGEIARGLLYLHQDSRLRIIHRDLKSSNVLLDAELNPKISDFGLARTFQGDQCGDNTKRIVGTYGYMAPEYGLYGLFSVKSDVFSFGVLLLEIVTGQKNGCFHHPHQHHNLIGYQRPEDRPNMSAVVLMLNGESSLPQPKQPGFLIDMIPTEFTSSRPDSCTANQITFSSFEAR